MTIRVHPKLNPKMWSGIFGKMRPTAERISQSLGPCRNGLLSWYRGGKADETEVIDSIGAELVGFDQCLSAQAWTWTLATSLDFPQAMDMALDEDWTIEFGVSSGTTSTRVVGDTASWDSQVSVPWNGSAKRVHIQSAQGTIRAFDWTGWDAQSSDYIRVEQRGSVTTAWRNGVPADSTLQAFPSGDTLEANNMGNANGSYTTVGNRIWGVRFQNAAGGNELYAVGQYCADANVPIKLGEAIVTITMSPSYDSAFFTSHNDGIIGFNLNERGYTVATGPIILDDLTEIPTAAGTIVPADTDPIFNDISGRSLQYQGPFKLNWKYRGYAMTFDGATIKLTGAWMTDLTVVDYTGTAVPTVGAAETTFTAGWCSRIEYSDGTILILESGPTSTQITCYDISINENHASISGGAPPFFTTVTEDAWYLPKYGWSLTVNGYEPVAPNGYQSILGAAITAPKQSLRALQPGQFKAPQDKRLLNADIQPQGGNAAIEYFFQSDGTANWLEYDNFDTWDSVSQNINDQYFLRTERDQENTREILIYAAPIDGDCLTKTGDWIYTGGFIVDDDNVTFMSEDDLSTFYLDD